ncbi:hypothetical protein DFP72DRAFT_817212 [Ephemerocybe angulata]|uniref:Tyrosine-protein kinase ephrin type A/B receptor-like domain-containing protein n=1 Tax=Ephemerocybe angulata TaxID=980116 RepID=A0A8H6HRX9_9AGAR|nr:hypothetical protein DFP72DRAFT_817212 [Tulosesus angulatus]
MPWFSSIGTILLVLSTCVPAALSNKQKIDRGVDSILFSGGGSKSPCKPGTFGAGSGVEPCTSCPAGAYQPGQGRTSCIAASAGYYVPTSGQTSQTICPAGTYTSTTGSKKCLSCPAGYKCPNAGTSTPQICAAGTYSATGSKACTACAVGYFQAIAGTAGCCACPAGWYTSTTGSISCTQCPAMSPYCSPGATSRSLCSTRPGSHAPSKTCGQSSSGDCPASPPISSSSPGKRNVMPKPRCKNNEKACPVYSGLLLTRYVCMDVMSNLEACGDCRSFTDGWAHLGGGHDCSIVPFANEVSCNAGKCDVGSCQPGYIVSADRSSCVEGTNHLNSNFPLIL